MRKKRQADKIKLKHKKSVIINGKPLTDSRIKNDEDIDDFLTALEELYGTPLAHEPRKSTRDISRELPKKK